MRHQLELLSPAKDAGIGKIAIDHGADAVYIGGPSFGARQEAGNSVGDIAKLAAYAHRFDARVLVAMNTLLKDEELEAARALAWDYFEAGADALILQDMGLLEMDLPPIALHASTQCDIRSVEKARFLEASGFSQLVLARELSLPEIAAIADKTTAVLEVFIHGALCVGYSGLCNFSFEATGRSANRGACAQMCRLPFDLENKDGKTLVKNRHLLSLKDNAQGDNLAELIASGVSSFKIEGRLKNAAYVQNVTAFYRQKLDAILENQDKFQASSLGKTRFFFTPNIHKTFHRGFSDYFMHERATDSQAIVAFDSPAFMGERIGTLLEVAPHCVTIKSEETLSNGDGLTAFDTHKNLIGCRANRVEMLSVPSQKEALFRVFLRKEEGNPFLKLPPNTPIFRNADHAFENSLKGKTAERKIALQARFFAQGARFFVRFCDEKDLFGEAFFEAKEAAKDQAKARELLIETLRALGQTHFFLSKCQIECGPLPFVPASLLKRTKNEALLALEAAQKNAYTRPPRISPIKPPLLYPEKNIDHRANILNAKARAFYEKHGATVSEMALEHPTNSSTQKVLLYAKHCVRYSLNACPKQVRGTRPEPLHLRHGNKTWQLSFDCKRCEMHLRAVSVKKA